jgi:hypothetical protein
MGLSVLKRLLIVLVAVAFIGANLPANCVAGPAMQSSDAMTAPLDDPCLGGSDDAPATELAKMLCGALACAGILGLPTRQMIATPDIGKRLHPPRTADEMTGISIKPDPFPPRPTAHG